MSAARLFLSGIAASGHHGARPGEKDEPQPFVVDLDLEVDVADDAIDGTADYRAITESVRTVVARGLVRPDRDRWRRRWPTRVLAMPHVTRVTALVHKPNAARRLGIDGVAAAATAPG